MPKEQKTLPNQREFKPKSIKNVYIKKINSLVQASSGQALSHSLFTCSYSKKLFKTESDGKLKGQKMGKNALKLHKNRESARKARLRKKLYVQLLEGKVSALKYELQKCKKEEQHLEHWSQSAFISELENQDLGKFLCSNRTCGDEYSEQIIQEIGQLGMPQLMKKHHEWKKYSQSEEIQNILNQMEIEGQQCNQLNSQLIVLNKDIQRLKSSQNTISNARVDETMSNMIRKVHGTDKQYFQERIQAERQKNSEYNASLGLLHTEGKILHFNKYMQ